MKNYKLKIKNIKQIILATFIIWAFLPGQTRQADSLALVALYNSTNGENWTWSWNLSQSMDTWSGVTLTGDRVTELDLNNNNLVGTIPSEIGDLTNLTSIVLFSNDLSGSIPPEIGNLSNLSTIKFSANNLSESIPSEIGNLTNLTELWLGSNNLSGSIPPEVGSLTNLTLLYMHANSLSGSIPPEIGNLTNLILLYSHANNLSGSIPSEIGNLMGLYYLTLDNNNLSGSIPPDIGNLTNLGDLWLSGNNLSGSIPLEIGGLTSLDKLYLNSNGLSGVVPDEITNLIDLKELRLYSNQLTDLPALTPLTLLTDLEIENNRFTFGDIEPNISVPSTTFTYSPQDSVGTERDTVAYLGSNLTLSVDVGGTLENNTYTWKKDGGQIDQIMGDSTYTITSLDFPDAGVYTCEVINSGLFGLTLYTRPINLTVELTPRAQDSLALVTLYDSTGGDGWTNNTNWTPTNSIDTWYGVTVTGNRVSEINLSSNNLVGSIPPEIGNLSSLTSLNFSSNSLNGNIPPEIGDITNLNFLYLFLNSLSGPIPAEIGNLTNLTKINLNSNSLSGTIPSQMGNLINLTDLNLSSNLLSNQIPTEIGNLGNLAELFLNFNSLSGAIPVEIGNLNNLKSLVIRNNQFNHLPLLSSLTSLEYLWIENNQFTFEDIEPNMGIASKTYTYSPQDSVGVARDTTVETGSNPALFISVGGASNEYQWYKDGSLVSGATANPYTIASIDYADAGIYTLQITNSVAAELTLYSRPINVTVVASFRETDSLALVALYDSLGGDSWTDKTNWKTANPIDTWFGIMVSDDRVTEIIQDDNNLAGTIPPEIGNLTNLSAQLVLCNNQLSGFIPTEIGNLINLLHLDIENNQLNGEIPSEIGNLTNLQGLYLSGNQLNGMVSSAIGNLINLENLQLSNNNFSGSIPVEIGNLTNLQLLNLQNNQLSGSIPFEIGALTNLTFLDFNDNQLTGPIPAEIGNLSNLYTLNLYYNQLTDSIPVEIGNLTNLTDLDLSANSLSGPIPEEIGNLTNLTSLRLHQNSLSEAIPFAIYNLINLEILHLNDNSLIGSFPPELGNLVNLQSLTISANSFVGSIPSEITNLTDLHEFYLDNNFFDELPDISSLLMLADFPIHNNRFTFEDIEPNVGISGIQYSPQDSVGAEKDTTLYEGNPFSYTVTVGGANNVYQWYKDANPVTGANTDILNITSVSPSDEGKYILQITNTVATDLTLYSRPLTIAVGALPTISTTHNYDIRVTTAGLVTEVNPNNFETLVWFEYGTTTSYGTDTSSEPDTLYGNTIQEVSKNIYGLIRNTTYHFRTVAENAAGIQNGPDDTFTTNDYNSTGNIVTTVHYLPQNGSKENYFSTDYRLFGLPGSSVIPMADIMPGTADNEWIAYWDNGEANSYKIKYDGSSTFNFTLGKAFWIICQQDITISETVSFPSLNADDEAAIPLRSGWNLFTNPFQEPVEWAEITSRNGDITYQLWEWTGGWNNPLYIEPYKGYMIFNGNNLSSLNIIYPVASSKRKATETQYDWAVHVHMTSKNLSESALHFGIAPGAEYSRDEFDYHKPRMFSDMPGSVFIREEWDEEMPDFATDFRPEIETIQTWSMNAVMPIGKAVEFYFEGIEAVPEEHDVFLVDCQRKSSQNLRIDPVYKLTSPMKNRQFDILVGNPEEMDEILAELVVSEFVLAPNFPNPFNPTTVIPIELPEMTRVELTVYDILGQRVKTLHKGELNSGRHLLTWDGTNSAGIKVASGVYLYRIKTGSGFQAVRKMVLMK